MLRYNVSLSANLRRIVAVIAPTIIISIVAIAEVGDITERRLNLSVILM